MPASLLTSQFATLEPLAPDEDGIVLDVDRSVDEIVQGYLAGAVPRRTDAPQLTVLADDLVEPVAPGWQLITAALVGDRADRRADHGGQAATRSWR